MLALLVTFLLLSVFLGSRWIIISSVIFVLSYRVFSNKGKVSLWKMGVGCAGLLMIAIFLAGLRGTMGGPLELLANFWYEFFYSSHFSDNRDFAWLLSYWDGELLYGKTYLAAFLSFLPRFASAFRSSWSYGAYTADFAQLDTTLHAGLRSGPFGEMYFNFGCLGVILIGLLAGYTLRVADVRLKEAITKEDNVIKGYACTFAFFLVSNLLNSAGFWLFYFFIFVNIVLYLLRRQKIYSNKAASI